MHRQINKQLLLPNPINKNICTTSPIRFDQVNYFNKTVFLTAQIIYEEKTTHLSWKIILWLAKCVIKNHSIDAYRDAIILLIPLSWRKQLLIVKKLWRPSNISRMKNDFRSGLEQKHH